MSSEKKQHNSVIICGHVDAGKSTTTGRLIYELGGISQRDMQKLEAEAEKRDKSTFKYAYLMDRQGAERDRGLTITCSTMEFFTESKHYTVIDAPGHRDFIKNMITGASQPDVALIMVPADGNFTSAIAKGGVGAVMGQTRQHALLVNLLGVKQIIVGINKMDCPVANYSQARYEEVRDEAKQMLLHVGWKRSVVENEVAFVPMSGFHGDNLTKKSANMPWWNGVDLTVLGDSSKKVHVHTLLDALEEMVQAPSRKDAAPLRVPVSAVLNIRGVGTVVTGRVEQGVVNVSDEVKFLPTHSSANASCGKVFSIEMHHKNAPKATAGDNVGMCIKNLNKANMPRSGDIMTLSMDHSLGPCKSFTAVVRVLHHPGLLKVGYTPIGFVRTSRSPLRLARIDWKIGKETGGTKKELPHDLKANEMAQVVFEPQQPFVVDTFANCAGLGRIAVMEGSTVVMLGKVIQVQQI